MLLFDSAFVVAVVVFIPRLVGAIVFDLQRGSIPWLKLLTEQRCSSHEKELRDRKGKGLKNPLVPFKDTLLITRRPPIKSYILKFPLLPNSTQATKTNT